MRAMCASVDIVGLTDREIGDCRLNLGFNCGSQVSKPVNAGAAYGLTRLHRLIHRLVALRNSMGVYLQELDAVLTYSLVT